jgi:glycosyltransferase involved in cell wall biosynthesis
VVAAHRRLDLLPAGAEVHVLDYGAPAVAVAPHPRGAGPFRLGFIGSLAPHKGLHVAAAALARLERGSALLDVWGEPRNDAYARECDALAAGAEVRFHAPFDADGLVEALAGIDLLLAPSVGLESYGLAVAEALQAGVPVLASDRGALPERLASGGGATFDPDRPETLAHWIERSIREPELLERWRREAPRSRPFEAHVTELEGVYAAAVASPPGITPER